LTVHVEIVGDDQAITVVTLDRPERRNALDHATLGELTEVLAAAEARPTRVLVLTGASGHFCAGADLQGVEDASFATLLQGVLDRLVHALQQRSAPGPSSPSPATCAWPPPMPRSASPPPSSA